MQEASFATLLSKAGEMTKQGIEWHHHYLPPACYFNKSADHLIMLETMENRWAAKFADKPLAELKQMEEQFFAQHEKK